MAYTKTNWQNDQAPAINAANLNKIEQGIFNNDALLSSIMNTLGIDTQTWVSTDSYVEGQVVVYNNKLYKNITGNYTTTPPDEDTTNWLLISIINSNGKIDKSFIPYFNNSYSNSTDEGYSCNYINWKLAGTNAGSGFITIPSNAKELHIMTHENDQIYTKNIMVDDLVNGDYFYDSFYVSSTNSGVCAWQYYAASGIHCLLLQRQGVSKISDSTTKIYYK